MIGLSRKGEEPQWGMWLLLSLLLAAFLLAGSVGLYQAGGGDLAQDSQVRKSAYDLTNAINSVYKETLLDNYEYNVTVNVTLPSRKDPKWIIYSGMEVVRPLRDSPQFCPGVCFGFIDRTGLEERTLIEASSIDPFWLVNPCEAEVNVYFADGKIRLRFNETTVKGYCCARDDGARYTDPTTVGWPDDSGADTNSCQFQR